MSFTQSSHIIVTFDEYNVPDKKSVGSEFNGANIAKEIWFAFTDETLTNYTVVVNAKRADGDLGYRLCSKKTVDGVDYDYFALDSWFTEKVGKVILAVKVYKSSDITVNEDGTYTLLEDEPLIVVGDLFHLVVNYAPNADSLVAPFDPSDMQVIMAAIGNKASKSEVPLIVTALPSDLDTLIDGVYKYDSWFFMLTDGTLYRIDNDTATFIGKIGESVKYVKSSEILAKGNVVQLDTATGGFVQVKKAIPSEINVRPQLILGFALQAFTANGWGLILMQGYLSGIDTSGASADGDLVYFDSSNGSAGLFTFTRPTPPKAIVILGTVSNDNVNGSIDVRLSTMPMSDQVNHDVTPTNYSSASQTVKENLKGIDTAIGALNTFKDTTVPSTYIPLSQKGAINGVATLGADGKVPDAQMPNITITDTNVVNSQALMLALTAQVGDVCVRSDLNKTYILKTAPATVLGNWQELLTPTDSVLSVAGKTGAVTLVKADVGLGNVDNTSDANKPISTATQTALDAKADKIYATNLVTNGNFTSTTGWTSYRCATTVSGNVSTSTGNISASYFSIYQNLTNAIVGHKYFGFVYVMTTSTCDNIQLNVGHSGTSSSVSQASPVSSTWYRLSQIVTPTTSATMDIGTRLYATETNTLVLNTKYLGFIDLTATFGSGKEPTVAQMNADLAYYTNSWFDGTVPFINCFTLNATKANRKQEDWITPTLLNSWVAFDTARTPMYMKDDFGFVHFKGCIKSGTLGANAFILPTAYRPAGTRAFAVKSNSLFGYVDFAGDGTVVVNGSNSSLYLDGVMFMAGQ